MKRFKTLLAMFFVVLTTVLLGACSCSKPKPVSITGFVVIDSITETDDKQLGVYIGDTIKFDYTIMPNNASTTTVNVKSVKFDDRTVIDNNVVISEVYQKTAGVTGSFTFTAIAEGKVALVFSTVDQNIEVTRIVEVIDREKRKTLDDIKNVHYDEAENKITWDRVDATDGFEGYLIQLSADGGEWKEYKITSNEYDGITTGQDQIEVGKKYSVRVKAIGDNFRYNTSENWSDNYSFYKLTKPQITSFAEGYISISADSNATYHTIHLVNNIADIYDNEKGETFGTTGLKVDIKSKQIYKENSTVYAVVTSYAVANGFAVGGNNYNIIDGCLYVPSSSSDSKAVHKINAITNLKASIGEKNKTITLANNYQVEGAYGDGVISWSPVSVDPNESSTYRYDITFTYLCEDGKYAYTTSLSATDNPSFEIPSDLTLTNVDDQTDSKVLNEILKTKSADISVSVVARGLQDNGFYTTSSEPASITVRKAMAVSASNIGRNYNTETKIYSLFVKTSQSNFTGYQYYIVTPSGNVLVKDSQNGVLELNELGLTSESGDYTVYCRGMVDDPTLGANPYILSTAPSEQLYTYTKLTAPEIEKIDNKGNIIFTEITSSYTGFTTEYYLELSVNGSDSTPTETLLSKNGDNKYNIFDSGLTLDDPGTVYNATLKVVAKFATTTVDNPIVLSSNKSSVYQCSKLVAPSNIKLTYTLDGDAKLTWNGGVSPISGLKIASVLQFNDIVGQTEYETCEAVLSPSAIGQEKQFYDAIVANNTIKIYVHGSDGLIDSDVTTIEISRSETPVEVGVVNGVFGFKNKNDEDKKVVYDIMVGDTQKKDVSSNTDRIVFTFDGFDISSVTKVCVRAREEGKFPSVYNDAVCYVQKLSAPDALNVRYNANKYELRYNTVSGASTYVSQMSFNGGDKSTIDVAELLFETAGEYVYTVTAIGSVNSMGSTKANPAYITSDSSATYTVYKMQTPTSIYANASGLLQWVVDPQAKAHGFTGANGNKIEYSVDGEEWTQITSSLISADVDTLNLDEIITTPNTYYFRITSMRDPSITENITLIDSETYTSSDAIIKVDATQDIATVAGELRFKQILLNGTAINLSAYNLYLKEGDGEYRKLEKTNVVTDSSNNSFRCSEYTLNTIEGTDYIAVVLLNITEGKDYTFKVIARTEGGLQGIESVEFKINKIAKAMPTIEYSNVNRQHIKFDGNMDTDSAYVINYSWQTPGNGSSTYTIKKNSTYGVMTTESGLSGTISGEASGEGVYEYTLDTYLLDLEAWTFTLKDESGADSITNGNFTRDGSKLSWKWSDGATINGTLVGDRNGDKFIVVITKGVQNNIGINEFTIPYTHNANIYTYYYPIINVTSAGTYYYSVKTIGNTTTDPSLTGYISSENSDSVKVVKLSGESLQTISIFNNESDRKDYLQLTPYTKTVTSDDDDSPASVKISFYVKTKAEGSEDIVETLYKTPIVLSNLDTTQIDLTRADLFNEAGALEVGDYTIYIQYIGSGLMTDSKTAILDSITNNISTTRLQAPTVSLLNGIIQWTMPEGQNQDDLKFDLYIGGSLIDERKDLTEYTYSQEIFGKEAKSIRVVSRAEGKISSNASAEYMGTPLADKQDFNLHIEKITSAVASENFGGLKLVWNAIKNSTSYTIYYRTAGSDEEYKELEQIGSGSTSIIERYLPNSLDAGLGNYEFKVVAIGSTTTYANAEGEQDKFTTSGYLFSNSGLVTVTYIDNVASVTVASGVVSWDNIAEAYTYVVEYSYKTTGSDEELGKKIITTNNNFLDMQSLTRENANMLSTYSFKVRAIGSVKGVDDFGASVGTIIVPKTYDESSPYDLSAIKANIAKNLRVLNGMFAYTVSLADFTQYTTLAGYTDSIVDIANAINANDEAVVNKYPFLQNMRVSINGAEYVDAKATTATVNLEGDIPTGVNICYALPNEFGKYSVAFRTAGNTSDGQSIVPVLISNDVVLANIDGANTTKMSAFKLTPPITTYTAEGVANTPQNIKNGVLSFISSSYYNKANEKMTCLDYKIRLIEGENTIDNVVRFTVNAETSMIADQPVFSVDLNRWLVAPAGGQTYTPIEYNKKYTVQVFALGTVDSSASGVTDVLLNSDSYSDNSFIFFYEPTGFGINNGSIVWNAVDDVDGYVIKIYGTVIDSIPRAYSNFVDAQGVIVGNLSDEYLIGQIPFSAGENNYSWRPTDFVFSEENGAELSSGYIEYLKSYFDGKYSDDELASGNYLSRLLPGVYNFAIVAKGDETTKISSTIISKITAEVLPRVEYDDITVSVSNGNPKDGTLGQFVWKQVNTISGAEATNDKVYDKYSVSVVSRSGNDSSVYEENYISGINTFSLNGTKADELTTQSEFAIKIYAAGDNNKYLSGDSMVSSFFNRLDEVDQISINDNGIITWKGISYAYNHAGSTAGTKYEVEIVNGSTTQTVVVDHPEFSLLTSEYPTGTYYIRIKTLAIDNLHVSEDTNNMIRKLNSKYVPTNYLAVTKLSAPSLDNDTLKIVDGVVNWQELEVSDVTIKLESNSYRNGTFADTVWKYVAPTEASGYIEIENALGDKAGFVVTNKENKLSMLQDNVFAPYDANGNIIYNMTIKYKGNPKQSIIDSETGDYVYILPSNSTKLYLQKLSAPGTITLGAEGEGENTKNRIIWDQVSYIDSNGATKYIKNYKVEATPIAINAEGEGVLDYDSTQYFMRESEVGANSKVTVDSSLFKYPDDETSDKVMSFDVSNIITYFIKQNSYAGVQFRIMTIADKDSYVNLQMGDTQEKAYYISSSYSADENVFTITTPKEPENLTYDDFGTVSWTMPKSVQNIGFDIKVYESYTITERIENLLSAGQTVTSISEEELKANITTKYGSKVDANRDIGIDETNQTVTIPLQDTIILNKVDNKTPLSYKLRQIGKDYNIKLTSLITSNGTINLESNYSAVLPITKYDLFESGNGSESDPYEITSMQQLFNINYYMDKHYVISNDITLGYLDTDMWSDSTYRDALNGILRSGWTPIGAIYSTSASYANTLKIAGNADFTGSIDGRGHTIGNVRYNSSLYMAKTSVSALIGTNKGTIQNIKISFAGETMGVESSGLVFNNIGTIQNIQLLGSMTIRASVTKTGYNVFFGGVAYTNTGTIQNVKNSANIDFAIINNIIPNTHVAGIACQNKGTIQKCGIDGTITATGVAGMTDGNYGSVTECYNKATVTLTDYGNMDAEVRFVGIVDENNASGIVSTCYTDLPTVVTINRVGNNNKSAIRFSGLVGQNKNSSLTIDASYVRIGYKIATGGSINTNNVYYYVAVTSQGGTTNYSNCFHYNIGSSTQINTNSGSGTTGGTPISPDNLDKSKYTTENSKIILQWEKDFNL